MSDEKPSPQGNQPVELTTEDLKSEQEVKNAAGQIASGEAPLPEEELNKVAGGMSKPIGGKPVKYM